MTRTWIAVFLTCALASVVVALQARRIRAERARLGDAERRSRLGEAHARLHLTLMSEMSLVLARMLDDPRPALDAIAAILTRDLADSCVIGLTNPGGHFEIVAARRPASDGELSKAERSAMQRVMVSGTPELTYVGPVGTIEGVADDHAAVRRARGFTSWLTVPIRLRGLSIGALLVATMPERRGLRPTDQAAMTDLAARLAVSIERSYLYSETQSAARAAQGRATQLSRLIDAVIKSTGSLDTPQLLETLAEEAAVMLASEHAQAWVQGDAGYDVEYGRRPAEPTRIGSPLVTLEGLSIGYLSVERSASSPYDEDEQAVLVLLARMGSVALHNATLYATAVAREERLQTLVEASPLGILELDLTGAVRNANAAAMTLFGGPDLVLPDEVLERLKQMTVRAVAGEVTEEEITFGDGDDRLDLWLSTAPVRRTEELPIAVLALVSDATERRRLEQQLIESQRNDALAKLAGGIAHDFNNLLTIIVGYSELLQRSFEPGSYEWEEIGAIQQAGRHATVITNQLLTLSRHQVLRPVVVDVATVCRDLVPMLQRLAGDAVRVETRLRGSAAISADPGQLEQVLFNLVLNSRDAMRGGGTITIEVDELSDGDRVSLSVTDTGVGMDAETLRQCREPFFTTKGRRGIGLGMATVASIVDRSGAQLEIDSEPGAGTTMRISFPRVDARRSDTGSARDRARGRALVVDDDSQVLTYATKALLDAGFEVDAVSDVGPARERLEGERFDLLVSDVVLPGGSGVDLVKETSAQFPELAVVLITGYAGADAHLVGLASVPVVRKPFSADEIVTAAHEALTQVEGSNL